MSRQSADTLDTRMTRLHYDNIIEDNEPVRRVRAMLQAVEQFMSDLQDDDADVEDLSGATLTTNEIDSLRRDMQSAISTINIMYGRKS